MSVGSQVCAAKHTKQITPLSSTTPTIREDAQVPRVHFVDAQSVLPNTRPAGEQWRTVSGHGFFVVAPESKLKWVLGNVSVVHDAPVRKIDARRSASSGSEL